MIYFIPGLIGNKAEKIFRAKKWFYPYRFKKCLQNDENILFDYAII